MTVGKTKEFAQAILEYYVSGSDLPTHSGAGGLWVGLVSANPTSLGDQEPYQGSVLTQCEVSAGNYRAQVAVADMGLVEKDTTISAMKVANSNGSVDFSLTAPANFSLSGYVLCLSQTSTDASAYIGYEIFDGASASKQRSVTQGDTIKINTSNFILKER